MATKLAADLSTAIAPHRTRSWASRSCRNGPRHDRLKYQGLVIDNYGTHKHDNVTAWLEKNPRFTLHFIPTSSSWLNLVERWFREITDKRIRRGSFKSVADLITAIEDYIEHHNSNPKPYKWTKTADEIIEKVRHGRIALQQVTAAA